MRLENKKILIISPQSWSEMHISKHHYALELIRKNNLVYFLNPVVKSKKNFISLEPHENLKSLNIVSIGLNLPAWVKFKLNFIYQWLLKKQLKKILKSNIGNLDLVWDFDCNHLTRTYNYFNSKIIVFHAVDQGYKSFPKRKKPDLIITVSKKLMEEFRTIQCNKLVLNHGIGKYFKALSEEQKTKLQNIGKKKGIIQVGYIGNLALPIVNRSLLSSIIKENPDIEFHFIGPFVANDKDCIEWIESLQKLKNLKLYGKRNHQEMIELMKNIDFFIYYYNKSTRFNADNSHKILEYLSTGKVVLGSILSEYEGKNLFVMINEEDKYLTKFREICDKLDWYNSPDKILKRIDFVSRNTYKKHIQKIESFL